MVIIETIKLLQYEVYRSDKRQAVKTLGSQGAKNIKPAPLPPTQ